MSRCSEPRSSGFFAIFQESSAVAIHFIGDIGLTLEVAKDALAVRLVVHLLRAAKVASVLRLMPCRVPDLLQAGCSLGSFRVSLDSGATGIGRLASGSRHHHRWAVCLLIERSSNLPDLSDAQGRTRVFSW